MQIKLKRRPGLSRIFQKNLDLTQASNFTTETLAAFQHRDFSADVVNGASEGILDGTFPSEVSEAVML